MVTQPRMIVWISCIIVLYAAGCNFKFGYDDAGDTEEEITIPAVTTFTAQAGFKRIILSWTAPDDDSVEGVRIVRKTAAPPERAADGTQVYDGTEETYTDTGLTNDTEYYYTAFCYTTDDATSEGVSVSAIPQSPPAAVSDVTVTAGDCSLVVSWTPDTDADRYRISLSDEQGSCGSPVDIDSDMYTHRFDSVLNGMEYTVEVTALKDLDDGDTLESPPGADSGVPIALETGLRLFTEGTSDSRDDPYDTAHWIYTLQRAVCAFREVLSGMSHEILLDSTPVVSTTIENEFAGEIAVVTSTPLESGFHTVETVIRGSDASERTAVQQISGLTVEESIYYTNNTSLDAVWSDFPAEAVITSGPDGVVILDREDSSRYAEVDYSHEIFDSQFPLPAGFMSGILTLVPPGPPDKCWEIDFTGNIISRITGDSSQTIPAEEVVERGGE